MWKHQWIYRLKCHYEVHEGYCYRGNWRLILGAFLSDDYSAMIHCRDIVIMKHDNFTGRLGLSKVLHILLLLYSPYYSWRKHWRLVDLSVKQVYMKSFFHHSNVDSVAWIYINCLINCKHGRLHAKVYFISIYIIYIPMDSYTIFKIPWLCINIWI